MTVSDNFISGTEMSNNDVDRRKSKSLVHACLPSPVQTWAHSTCSQESLSSAIHDSKITAIETDIVMGSYQENSSVIKEDKIRAIMAHPPANLSDLTVERFFVLTTKSVSIDGTNQSSSKELLKHLKLDFKEAETIRPTIESIVELGSLSTSGHTIFLNADIFPGPGHRSEPLQINSEYFVKECFDAMKKAGDSNVISSKVSFSLGWKVDCRSFDGYTHADVRVMRDFILKHNLVNRTQGVVLAVNARLLSKDCKPFDSILREVPNTQLLIWTGTGEPPISNGKISSVKTHFKNLGLYDKVGFDCKIADNYIWGGVLDT
eukprot:CAMPEP_0184870494 /NCGR_PEP_ID=MMETSP0580-20130426/37647_1 /TAXON_ID=1118495 /ORGANISM="Dactyliosolen fragilissimus" /LENGTH=318 /DNA_ID=CAMNT_0027372577 /DNA_START=80 /DNA_END=1032 /DNA_ORIENTATION=-